MYQGLKLMRETVETGVIETQQVGGEQGSPGPQGVIGSEGLLDQ